ncbi:MFS transporter [Kiloniella laminariae]|uniref:MFS transporter n=1 Tax=Kiloniella laminariae TaxID=454162 RepID=UPI0003624294|nr:MFS transporter [Kiloniella laminariae]
MSSLACSMRLYLLVVSNLATSIGQGIALIATPWFIINNQNGSEFFGIVAFATNVLIFLTAPWFGVLVDRFSRKKILVSLRLGFISLLLVLLLFVKFYPDQYSLFLALYFTCGSFFLILNQSSRSAFIQEIFSKKQYARVNSIMEVEGQSAAVITGAIAAVILSSWSLEHILCLNIAVLGLSLVTILAIGYTLRTLDPKNHGSFGQEFIVGLKYLVRHPKETIFIFASFTPYNCVQTANYLVPVLLISLLGETVEVLALYEIVFGAGAIVAGLGIVVLFKDMLSTRIILANMTLYTFVLALQSVWPSVWTIVWMAFFLGFSNSALRVARNNWMMNIIDPQVFGRVMTTVPSLMLGFKALLIGLVAFVVEVFTPHAGLFVLFGFQLFSQILAWYCQKSGLKESQGEDETILIGLAGIKHNI